jgi:tRNA U34 5-methylaminomethyl-2-thiouridine-forming methyltransferase MnmC
MTEKNPVDMEVCETEDGSYTAFNGRYKEHYHNLHGAWQETQGLYGRVADEFLRHFQQAIKKNIVIADVGFGLGYNFLLAFQLLKSCSYPDRYLYSFEKEKLSQLPLKKIQYPETLSPASYILNKLLDKNELFLEGVQIQFIPGDFRDNILRIPPKACHIWFWDPFSAQNNPEMWSQDLFRIVFEKSAPDAILVTYAKSGYIRRALAKGGFTVFSLQNLGGKKEATLATKGNLHKFMAHANFPGMRPVNWHNYPGSDCAPLRDPLLNCEPEQMLLARYQKKIQWQQRTKKNK